MIPFIPGAAGVSSFAPDASSKKILAESLPYVGIMALAIVILCPFPGPATWLYNFLMGFAL